MTTKLTEKNISSVSNLGINWQSVIVADGSTGTTGVAGRGYFINTTSAAHTFTLPATATFGDTILIKDYAGTFGTNALTIARNGNNIQGVANNSVINTNRASVELVYVDATRGWEYVLESNVADLQAKFYVTATGGTVLTNGNFKTHIFTDDGSFAVSCAGSNQPAAGLVDYLVIAGGGGGSNYCSGPRFFGSGGGAGGFRLSFSIPGPNCAIGAFPVTATTYPITVGGGGASTTNGSPSVFSTITSTGGGAGKTGSAGGGNPGGSGGGNYSGYTAGQGNTPPVSPPQGNPGGVSESPGAPTIGGSGGGAGGAGGGRCGGEAYYVPDGFVGPTPQSPSYGTPASKNGITPVPAVRYFAGGGSGAIEGRSGGGGGGGWGGYNPGPGQCAVANTGSGGAGSFGPFGSPTGGSGGKGIIMIRYKYQ
jgi:hypothetical protein